MAESTRPVPEATVARLPVYLRSLVDLTEARVATVSSERLAELAGVNAAKVRKDLSHLGSYGTRDPRSPGSWRGRGPGCPRRR